MSRQFGVINVASYSFNDWISRDNDIINLVNTSVVTTAANSAGDITVGNSFVIGIFGSNTLTATNLRGGNVTTSATLTLTSNTKFTGSQVNASANVYISSANVYVTSQSVVFVGNTSLKSNTTNSILDVISNTVNSNVVITANNTYISGGIYSANTLNVNGAVTFSNTLSVLNGLSSFGDVLASYANIDLVDIQTSLNISPSVKANSSLITAPAVNVTNQTNTATLYVTTSANVGTAVVANTSGVYTTGAVNDLSYSIGALFTANATLVTATAVNVTNQTNTATLYVTTSANIGSTTVANSIGIYTTGLVNALSYSVGTSFVANSSSVNSNQFLVGSPSSTGGSLSNTTHIIVGNSSVNTTITGTTITANTITAYNVNVLNSLIGSFSANGNIIPTTNNTYYLGSSGNVFNQAYSTTLYANTISAYSSNLNISTNVSISGTQLALGASLVTTSNFNFSGVSQVAIDTFPIATYRTAEYTLQFTDSVTTSYHATKLLVYHDGISAYSAEYAQLFNNSSLATIVVDVNSGNVRLLVTPASSTVTARINRTLLTV
jgi:hypothetical protein